MSTQLTVGNVLAISGGAVLALSVTAYLLTTPWADDASDESDAEPADGAFLRDVRVSGGPTSNGGVLGLSGRF